MNNDNDINTESDEKSETIVDGVKIIKEGNRTRFVILDMPSLDETMRKQQESEKKQEKSFFGKIWSWMMGEDDEEDKEVTVKPYAKIRDLSDPFGDKQYEGGTKSAVEVGLKVSF